MLPLPSWESILKGLDKKSSPPQCFTRPFVGYGPLGTHSHNNLCALGAAVDPNPVAFFLLPFPVIASYLDTYHQLEHDLYMRKSFVFFYPSNWFNLLSSSFLED
jgi:hypothetical protein